MLRVIRSVDNEKGLSQKGLTLVEILIALAINSIVILAVVTIVSNAMVSGKTAENRQELATDFGLLQNYFSREIPNAGGMALAAESAYYVENNCAARLPFAACSQSDRLTTASSDVGPVCTIQNWDKVTLTATFAFDGANPCCLTTTDIDKQQVMFVLGYDFRQLWVRSVDTAACTANFLAGPMSPHDNTTPLYNWKTGVIVPVTIDTFYLDMVTNMFMRYHYEQLPSGPSATSGRAAILADRMLDFQVMLGYDFNPGDGVVTDNGSSTDEWLYNFSGDSLSTAPFNVLPRNSLRMVGVGWVIGAPAGKSGQKSAAVLDGTSRTKTGWVVQSGVAKFGVRSIYVFD